jgi:hypothetical protein
MFTIKKKDRSITIGWQEIMDKIIKSLFLEDNKAIVGDRLMPIN